MEMMKKPDDENESSVLKAKLYEKQRIEEFLRAEIKELWMAIETSQASTLYRFYLFIIRIRKFSKVKLKILKKIFFKRRLSTRHQIVNNHRIAERTFFEFIFVIPSNKIELGGLQSAFELANFISNKGKAVKVIYLNHDPTGLISDLVANKSVATNYICNVVVVCGSEANDFVSSSDKIKYDKSVVLMQGPDLYFDSDWNRCLRFIHLLESSDLIIAISPYMAKISKFYGAKNVVTIPVGLDQTNFYFSNVPRKNTIVIPCRANSEKGTKLVVPLIPQLRKLGWNVIGFGDLPDLRMAGNFDDFLGRISRTELGKLLRESKILLDPSMIEGLGLTPLESAACGCVPIIGTRNSYEDLFPKNEEPYIEIPNFLDPDEVVRTIEEVKNSNYSKLFSDYVLRVDWEAGYQNTFDAINLLQVSES